MPGPPATPQESTVEPSAAADGSSHPRPLDPRPALVGLAHGSRHADGTASITSLMSVAAAAGEVDAEAAFLDLAAPDLITVASRLVAAGHRRAVVVPLLFTVAFHATVDVPEAVEQAVAETGLELLVSDILGTGPDVEDLVRASMAAAGVEPTTSVLLFAVGSSNPAANDAVHDLAARLSHARPGAVRAAFGTTDPRVPAVLRELGEPVAVVPLFLSPGLLLEPIQRLTADRGWTLAPPLGDLAAPLVLRRYDRARLGAELR
ncbi:sirohydrochlorin chelatase [uncultured Friedmanniella sp.]|uniref:sirohydrochlorin chelatase n=1 Tax=uncultured Friedmanniella sp. TaxID=335381 RepID=UPI0035CA9590